MSSISSDIVIVDYGAGNLKSIQNMLKKAGASSLISSDREVISQAKKLILPGVGAFDYGMDQLARLSLIPVLTEQVMVKRVPILGICLGAQLLTQGSQEGVLPGLGWVDAQCKKFDTRHLKVPHMGWNTVDVVKQSALFEGLDSPRFYFVHSYFMAPHIEDLALTYTLYGERFVSGISAGHITGLQFHPEKSHKYGLQLMRNFILRY